MENKKEEFVLGDLDVQNGIIYCGGKDRYINILQVCCDTAEDNERQIEASFEKENWKEYIIAVHGLKSSMKSIGAKELSDCAKSLEMAGREGDIKYIQENHRNMMQEYRRVMKMIQESPFVEKSERKTCAVTGEDGTLLEEQLFIQRIENFETAVYSLDSNKMLEILNELQKYQYAGVMLANPLSVIVRKVEQQDYMSALEYMAKLKAELDRRKNE